MNHLTRRCRCLNCVARRSSFAGTTGCRPCSRGRLLDQHRTRVHHRARYPIELRNFNRSFDHRIFKAEVSKITVHGTRKTRGSLLAALDSLALYTEIGVSEQDQVRVQLIAADN